MCVCVVLGDCGHGVCVWGCVAEVSTKWEGSRQLKPQKAQLSGSEHNCR